MGCCRFNQTHGSLSLARYAAKPLGATIPEFALPTSPHCGRLASARRNRHTVELGRCRFDRERLQPGALSQFSSVVEQQFCKLRVVGSNPTTGSNLKPGNETTGKEEAVMKINRHISSTIGAAAILLAATSLRGDDQMNIWPANSSELKGVEQQHIPTLHLYHGPKAAGKKPAVLICPAGGYKHHSDT
jgi:hypothetical protein